MAGFAVSEAEDKEVAEACLLVGEITEGWILAELGAELGPESEVGVRGLPSLGGGARVGKRERSREIR